MINSEDWVRLEDDEPMESPKHTRLSVDVNVLTSKGYVIPQCFYNYDTMQFYDEFGKHVNGKRGKVIAWQSM